MSKRQGKAENVAEKIARISPVVRIVWYLLLLIVLTVFVIYNWNTAVEFVFFTEFNGENLLFLIWAAILILPLFNSFEGFGVKLSMWQQKQAKEESIQNAYRDVVAKIEINAYNKDQQKAIEDFNAKINKIKEEGGRE